MGACNDRNTQLNIIGETQYPNGLVVPQLEGFDEAQNGIRNPLYVDFSISIKPPPEKAKAKFFSLNGVRYFIEEDSGGSGGSGYQLNAWRPAGQKWIKMMATQQNEARPPSFAAAWRMMDGARIEN